LSFPPVPGAQSPMPSDSPPLPLPTPPAAADKVIFRLQSLGAIERGELAGSARRGKPMVNDLDIVVIPDRAADLWGRRGRTWSDAFLNAVASGGASSSPVPSAQSPVPSSLPPLWRLVSTIHADSRQITLRSLRASAFKVELWTTTPDQFGWMLLIRTGPAELGPALMRCARARGFEPEVQHLRRRGGSGYEFPDCSTEQKVCELLGVSFRPPDTDNRMRMAREMHEVADAAGIERGGRGEIPGDGEESELNREAVPA